VARLFDHVEHLLERLIETPGRRLFRARLQPVELARAIARVMEEEQVLGPSGLVVPNHYRVELQPDEFQSFASWQRSLERDLARFVQRRALERGWICPARVVVQLASEPATPVGQPRVVPTTVDSAGGPRDPAAAADSADLVEATAVLTPVQPPAHPPSDSAAAWLELPDGRRAALDRPLMRLGRAPDNEVVLADSSVSRYHAQVQRLGAAYTLVDLGSHNGTRVGDVPVQQHVLRAGDVVHLGAVPVRFRVGG
jgi:hypothetical protein